MPDLLARVMDWYAPRSTDEPCEARWSEWCPHKPFANQERFLDFDGLEALYGGAAGGGKSDALLMDALKFVDVPGYAAILFRRTYSDLALPDAIMARSHDWLAGTRAHWSGETKTWTFPSGAKLSFGYLDTEQHKFRYQSAQFQFVGFDEVTQFPKPWYLYLFSRLRRRSDVNVPIRMRGATNPGGLGHKWVHERFILRPEGRLFVPSKLDDNPHIDQAEYRRALANLDETTRRQLEEGLWIQDTSGLVYQLERGRNSAAMPDLKVGEWRRILALDFGVADATALAELAWRKYDRTVYGLGGWKRTGMIPAEVGEEVLGLLATRKYDRIVGDLGGLGKSFGEEMVRRYGIPIEPADKRNKLGYIKLFNGAAQRAEFVVVEDRNAEYWDEVEALPWSDDDRTAEAEGFENHLCDAYLYGWRAAFAYDERDAPPALPPLGTPERAMADAAERKRLAIIEAGRRAKREGQQFARDMRARYGGR